MRQEIPRFDDILSALYKVCDNGQVFSAVDTEEQCRKLAVKSCGCFLMNRRLDAVEKEYHG